MFAHAVGAGALPAPAWLLAYIGVALMLGTAAALRTTWPAPRHAAGRARTARRPSRCAAGHVIGLRRLRRGRGGGDHRTRHERRATWRRGSSRSCGGSGLPIVCLLLGDVVRHLNPFVPVVALLDRGRATDPERRLPAWTPAVFLACLVVVPPRLPPAGLPPRPRGVPHRLRAGLGRRWAAVGSGVARAPARRSARCRRASPASVSEGGGRSPPVVGTAVLMIVWIGSTAFDGFTYRPFWQDVLGTSTGWARTLLNTVGLLWITAIVAGGVPRRRARRGARPARGGPRPSPRSNPSGWPWCRWRSGGSSATTSRCSSVRARTSTRWPRTLSGAGGTSSAPTTTRSTTRSPPQPGWPGCSSRSSPRATSPPSCCSTSWPWNGSARARPCAPPGPWPCSAACPSPRPSVLVLT